MSTLRAEAAGFGVVFVAGVAVTSGVPTVALFRSDRRGRRYDESDRVVVEVAG
jgi:hypothetical protein